MKKLITFCVSSLLAAGSLSARQATVTVLEGGDNYMGFMPLDISSDGRYLCGSTFGGPLFLSDWQNQDHLVFKYGEGLDAKYVNGEMRSITTSGFAIGLGPNVDFTTRRLSYTSLSDKALNVKGGLTDAISDDGRIITGLAYINDDPLYYAAYWEDGKCHLLPVPTEEESGWRIYGSRARFISDDGSVIAGYMVDRLSTYPFIYWTRQEDGSYEMHPVYLDMFCDSRDLDKPYVRFWPCAMSPSGEWVVMTLKETPDDGVISDISILALYHIPTGEIHEVKIDGTHGIPKDARLQVWDHGVADDGTIVGWFENRLGRAPFIVTAEDLSDLYPILFTEAFPEHADRFIYYDEEIGDDAVSCISADGRYIGGCAWILDVSGDYGYYEGYVIDRGEPGSENEPGEAGVESVERDMENARYYSVDGRWLPNPVRGINIVKYPDGTTSKLLVP